jgi:hypothetical protein
LENLSLSIMDAATESIIVVIAHPIAGNPSQFALERALRVMELDWRVLSFDVRPEHVATAIEGFAVTGIAGVLIDPSLEATATAWYQSNVDSGVLSVDCLYRRDSNTDKTHPFAGLTEQREWVDGQIQIFLGEAEKQPTRIWFGQILDDILVDVDRFPAQSESPGDTAAIKTAKLIALTEGEYGPVELDEEEWPENDGTTLVIDLSNGHPRFKTISDLGYRVISAGDRRIGTLQRCLKRWTGCDASADVMRDAIEEYLGV